MKINVSKKFFEELKTKKENNYVIVEQELSGKRVLGTFCLTLSLIFIFASMAGSTLLSCAYKNMVKDNSIVYADEIKENNHHIKEYANEVNSLNLNDLEIIMKVMNDIWADIDGYGKAEDLPIGYYRLAFQEEGKGVCTSFSDEFSARINAINPEYNARNIVVNLKQSEADNLETCDIEQNIIDSNIEDVQIKGEIELIEDTIFGNHMVSLVDIPGKELTLMVDATNLLIGIFKNGNIYVLNNNSSELMSYCYLMNDICLPKGSSNYIYLLANKEIDNDLAEEVSNEYGIEEQEKALEYVKKIENNNNLY